MTSRNLFFKLQMEDLKRRIWTIALAMLVFFLSLPVVCAMKMENFKANLPERPILNQIESFLGSQYIMVIITTIVGAIICGLSGYFYLHSRKKVDLYHSIPVRRELLFAVSYINGLLIYLIPYIINVILCIIVLGVNDFMSLAVLPVAIAAIAVNLLFFSLLYTIVIIAVMLTGNIIITCFGTAVFFLYGPMIMVLKELYFVEFFTSYYSNDNGELNLLFLSPLGYYIDTVINHMKQGFSGRIISSLIITIFLLTFAIFLYKNRPSEAAGKAMAFSFSKPIIKFLLVIPLSLGGGIFFMKMSDKDSLGWLIFGLFFAFVLTYAVIEIIYNFDIRSAFAYKKQMLSFAGIMVAIACIFQFDLFHYDSYLPVKNDIKSMSVAFPQLDEQLTYYDLESEESKYMSNIGYQLKYMELTDFDTAYDLARLQIDNSARNFERDSFNSFNVKYTLKSGKEVYRSYPFHADESLDMMKELYASSEFKEAHFPIYRCNLKNMTNISCSNMISNKEFSLDTIEINQLIEMYKEELNTLTLDDRTNAFPLATINLYTNNNYTYQCFVYPTFEKTISFLKEHGFDATKEVNVTNIKEIMISIYDLVPNEENNEAATYSRDSFQTLTYDEETQIKEIFSNLIQNEYYYGNSSFLKVEDGIEMTVVFRMDAYGNEQRYNFFFKQGEIPDFVKKDMK